MQELIDFFGLFQGTQEQVFMFVLALLAGAFGGILRVYLDHKSQIRKIFSIQETSIIFLIKFSAAGLIGAYLAWMLGLHPYSAFTTGFVSAYAVRYIIEATGVKDQDYFKYAVSGLTGYVSKAIIDELIKIEEVRGVTIKDPKDGSGKVFVVVDAATRPMEAKKLAEINKILDKYDLYGIDYVATEPEYIDVVLFGKLTVTDPAKKDEISEKIKNKVKEYFDSLGVGEPAMNAQIIKSALEASENDGFQDFIIITSSPEFIEGVLAVETKQVIVLKDFQIE
jgi:hypothetical protein